MSIAVSSNVIVVDTNVISYIFKRDTRGTLYAPHIEGRLVMIAAQTLAELEAMPLMNGWGQRRHAELRARIKKFTFAAADENVCLRWAEVRANAKRIGRPITVADSWIAATALHYNAPLVTHNPGDFINVPNLMIITEK